MPILMIHWNWEEAFDKFGFNDGDGLIFTDDVAVYLKQLGYEVDIHKWLLHNRIIISIKKNGKELIPFETINPGYDCPRYYLPQKIIAALDAKFPEKQEMGGSNV